MGRVGGQHHQDMSNVRGAIIMTMCCVAHNVSIVVIIGYSSSDNG